MALDIDPEKYGLVLLILSLIAIFIISQVLTDWLLVKGFQRAFCKFLVGKIGFEALQIALRPAEVWCSPFLAGSVS